MCGRRQGSCAIVVLFLGLTGCALDGFNAKYQVTPAGGSEPVISGSVDSVAERTSAMLQGLGITAVLQRNGNDVRLACTTDKGKHFAVIFTEESSQMGTQTRVKMEWDNGTDDVVAVRILAGLGGLSAR
jgi:hypothetical protein